MRRLLTQCALAAAVILILLLIVHQLKAPPFSVGQALPPGRVRPRLVNTWNTAVLLAPDGSLWAWGGTRLAAASQSSLMNVFPVAGVFQFPQRIGSDSDWPQVSVGIQHTLALKNDGSLWGWGWNGQGEVGATNDSPDLDFTLSGWISQPEVRQTTPNLRYDTPTRLGTDSHWSQICAGSAHSLALKNDGSLWSWGANRYGQLGDGTTNNSFVPTMIGTDQDWRTISAGAFNSYALKNDGTLWGWGASAGGNDLSPRQIAPGTNWVAISAHDFVFGAIRADGTLWLKGGNAHVVASAFISTPTETITQVGSDTDWSEIYAGENSLYARKRDGTWWACGDNRFCQLGFATSNNSVASPQRLPFAFDPWALVPADSGTTLLLAKDGKLWSWGKRLGSESPSASSQKLESLLAPVVKRFPSLRFLLKSDIDEKPHLLWELPPEVRRSLGSKPIAPTNNLTDAPVLPILSTN